MKVLERRVLPKQAKDVRADVNVLAARAKSTNILDLGDKGRAVEALQRHLRAAGLYKGPVSGEFDAATEQALKQFQTAKKLPASGALDKATLKALKTVNVFVKAGFKTAAKAGQRGSDIAAAERKLAKLGFLNQARADGVFDEATKKAVARYRKADKQLPDKGSTIGEKFYKELSQAAKAFDKAPVRRRDVTNARGVKRHQQLDEVVAGAAKKAGGLKRGAKGRAVEWVERHLQAAGYAIGGSDKTFGARTEAAVRAFQKKSGLAETGVVDAKTWAKLRGNYFGASSGTSPSQREGEKSGAVLRTEKLLKKLGYKTGKVDGMFDAATARAVRKFQSRTQGVKTSGQVGGGTQAALVKAVKKKEGAGALAKVVKLAQSQLGVRESPMGSNRTKYSAFFGRPPEPWCADFVSYLYTKAGKKLNEPWTPRLLQTLKNNGTYNRSNPKPGQIVMFDWNPNAGQPAEHTGIVEKVFRRDGKLWIQTIEGNSGNMVRRRQYPVSSSSIAGFGHIK